MKNQIYSFTVILIVILLFSFQYGCIIPLEDQGSEPKAEFTADPTTILPTGTVQFTDQSSNDPISWWWQFGDGGTSILQHPFHQYTSFESFDVSLTASNELGSNEIIKANYINASVNMGATGNVTDSDGNTYQTIKIGLQWWMAENLRSTHYNNGAGIQLITNNNDWSDLALEDKAMSFYNYEQNNAGSYGALYTWATAMNGVNSSSANPSKGVCPTGWHLPSDEEWMELEINLGMVQSVTDNYGYRGTNEGSKLAGGSSFWKNGQLKNDAAFGISGINIFPGGEQTGGGASIFLGEQAFFWTSTTYGTGGNSWDRRLLYDFSGVYREFADKRNGFSVRCVKN